MATETVESILPSVEIDIEKLHPNEWNPNEQTEETFNELTTDIDREGFDEPVIVVEDELAPGTFKIISGEHRWKACRVLGWKKIPCVVRVGWDEVAQKLKTVRRNLLRGSLNRGKFERLVNDVKRVYDVDYVKLSKEMGFTDEKEFWKNYQKDKEKKDKATTEAAADKKEMKVIDSLSVTLNEIFSQYGDTVPYNYLFFMFKKQFHLLVGMDRVLLRRVERLVQFLKENKKDANEVLAGALDREFERLGISEEGLDEEAKPE